jgi:hypothetical protein
VRVVVPEWHPGIVVTLAAGELPPECRNAGAWLRCKANLGAGQAVELAPTRLRPAEPPFDPSSYPELTVGGATSPAPAALPVAGPGCGDVVLHTAETPGAKGLDEIYITGHPPPAKRGGRAYLCVDGAVQGWQRIRAIRPLPNGTRVELDGPFSACTVPETPALSPDGVMDGAHGRQLWQWRTWARDVELSRTSA